MLFHKVGATVVAKNWITTGCAYEIKRERLVSTMKLLQDANIKFVLLMVDY